MDRFLLSGKQRIKIKEIQEFREIVKKLVAKSGVDLEFPEEAKPSITLKIMLWILRALAVFVVLFSLWLLLLGRGPHSSIDALISFSALISFMVILFYVGGSLTLVYGLIIIIPAVILYRDEQKQFRLELRTLIDIAEAAISALRDQRRKSMKSEINQAEQLIEEYRKNKLESNEDI